MIILKNKSKLGCIRYEKKEFYYKISISILPKYQSLNIGSEALSKSETILKKATYFKRRKPREGDLLNLKDINKIYDSIRMLDINFIKYPKAFIENKKIKFNFKEAKLKKNKIEAKVEILRK